MEYNVHFEFDAPGDEERCINLVDELLEYHPAASSSEFGRLEVWITLQAEDLRQAVRTGLAIAGELQYPLVAIEALTTSDFDTRNGLTPVPELIGAEVAAEILGVTRQAIGQQFTAGKLPGQRLGERGLVFARRDIETIAARRGISIQVPAFAIEEVVKTAGASVEHMQNTSQHKTRI